MRIRRSVHPLLLDPTYWRNRLQNLDLGHPSLSFTPRPDLSEPGCDVVEFRLRAHDDKLLWGFYSLPPTRRGPRPARVRSVSPADRPRLDPAALEQGVVEFVFQGPPGRCLRDRVLDVVRVVRMAHQLEGVDPARTVLGDERDRHSRDEYLIAEQLFAWNLVVIDP